MREALDPVADPLEGSAPAFSRARTLKVAVLSDATPGRNGVGTYYDDLVHHLGGLIGDVRLVCPPRDGEEVRTGWRFRMPGDPTQTLFVPRLGTLWTELRSMSPDLVIAPTPWLYGIVGMLAARRMGTAFCVAYHTEFPMLAELYWKRRRVMKLVSRWLAVAADGWMFRHASAVLVHNARLQRTVRSRGVHDAPLMGTPAPPSFLARPLRPIAETLASITYVGRLGPEKCIDQVLETARTFPRLKVRIVGDGPLRPEVEACARSCRNVELTGWVDRDRVLEILDTTDLLVLPSSHETFGTAAFEAMIRQRPVLVSPRCGIAEWPNLANGLFRIVENERLADAVRRVAGMDGAARRQVAAAGRAAAVEANQQTIDHWVATLDRLTANGTRP